jgi:hypothetical protein
VIYSLFRHAKPIPEDDLGLSDIVALLKLLHPQGIFFVLSALADTVVTLCGNLVSELDNQHVHMFIVGAIADPHLKYPCFWFAGNMSVCDRAEQKLLSDSGAIATIIYSANELGKLSPVFSGSSTPTRR